MFRGSVKGTCYPLHSPVSPSLPLLWSCVITFQLESTKGDRVKVDGPPTKSGHEDSKCHSNQQSHRLNILHNKTYACEFWHFYISVAKDSILLGCDIVSMGHQFLMLQEDYIVSEHLDLISTDAASYSAKMKSSKVTQITRDARNAVAIRLPPPYNIHIYVLRSSSKRCYSLNFKSWSPVQAPPGFKENVQA